MQERTEPDTIVTATLVPHPANAPGPAVELSVRFERQGDALWLRYIVQGDVQAVKWPVGQASGRVDRLWEHTCFEAFIETADGYREFNLSVSGAWASYAFTAYREGMAQAAEGVRVDPLDLAFDQLAVEGMVELPPGGRHLALSAVIEGVDGTRTYWALAHPSEKPDFHHPDSFVLDLP